MSAKRTIAPINAIDVMVVVTTKPVDGLRVWLFDIHDLIMDEYDLTLSPSAVPSTQG